MFRRKTKSRQSTRKPISFTAAIGLTFLVEAFALGLIAYNERRDKAALAQVVSQREALAISERIIGKAGTIEQTLALGYQAGWGPQATAGKHDDLDGVVSLADALTAPQGSRLWAAGETASIILARGQTVGLSAQGDLIIVHTPTQGAARLGLVKADHWLPDAIGERSFYIAPEAVNGVETVAPRTTLACTALPHSSISACVQSVRAPFGWRDLVGYGIYALLLAGPAIAALGLIRMIQSGASEKEAFEGQATRAGRVLSTVLQEAKAGFWSWNQERNEFWLSAEAAKLVGAQREGFYRAGALDTLILPEHLEAVRQAIATLPERGYISQSFANHDRTIWIDMRGRPDEKTGELNGILLDMTEMRAAVARTKRAEQRLRTALEGFSGPFALWDARKRIIYWNRAFATAFGLQDTLRVGMGYDTVSMTQAAGIVDRRISKDAKGSVIVRVRSGVWYKMVERKTDTGGLISMGLDVSADVQNEVELTRQQEHLRKLVLELERSEGHAGELARKLNEEKLRAERSANSKSAFLANMSHELRTPLNAINGFSEILSEQMYGPLGDQRYVDYAKDILTSGQHLLDMINDILDMAKVEAGKMTVDLLPIDLVDPVDAAVRMIRRKAEDKGIKLSLVHEDNLPHVDADHRAIRQMILNLVSNAIKFTDEGGEIRVSIDRKDDQIRVAVRDNGVGIPAEALPRLGQPFEQVSDTRDRNYDGTGLGLALTKSFAEMHGGRLTIASQEGRGTQVSFYLPIPKNNDAEMTSAA